MAWYNPASWSEEDWKRVGTAAATGGFSETSGLPGGMVGDALANSPVGNPLDPARADLSPVKAAQERAFGTQDKLAGEREGFAGQYDPARGNDIYDRQVGAIDTLTAAAAGKVPSPTELMLQRQGSTNAARAFGIASALQGRSPGGALDSALRARSTADANALQAAGIARANEMATARGQLVQGLGLMQGQQQNLMQLDQDWRKALLTGELGALDAGGRAAGAYGDASSKDAAGRNALTGSIWGTGASLLGGGVKSDKRDKIDVRPADRDIESLANSLKSFRFKYKKPAEDGEGERIGVMAQDIQKGGPVGKKMVSLGSDNRLRLDVGNAVGAALAMSAAALRRSKGERDN